MEHSEEVAKCVYTNARLITGQTDSTGFNNFCNQNTSLQCPLFPLDLLHTAVKNAHAFCEASQVPEDKQKLFARKHVVVEFPASVTHTNEHCASPIVRILVCPVVKGTDRAADRIKPLPHGQHATWEAKGGFGNPWLKTHSPEGLWPETQSGVEVAKAQMVQLQEDHKRELQEIQEQYDINQQAEAGTTAKKPKAGKVKAAKVKVQDNDVPTPGAVAKRSGTNHPMQPSLFVGDKDEKGSSMVYLNAWVTWLTHITWDMDHEEALNKIAQLKASNRNLLPLSAATYLRACTESTF
jgi:hypothetical protein